MKRTLFFWIDKLQIRRSERITLSVLMCSSMLLSAALMLIDFSPSPGDFNYEELEQIFHQRSIEQQTEIEAIMARYTPVRPAQPVAEDDPVILSPEVEMETYERMEPEQVISDTTRININEADAEKLQELPGIGPAYAKRIVEWREENGNFESVNQLLEIRGIGPARLESIRPLVRL